MATDATLSQPDDLIEGGLDVLHRKALTILKRIRDSAVDPDTGQKRGAHLSDLKGCCAGWPNCLGSP